MSGPPEGRKWNVDPKTNEKYYYSKLEEAYIYQGGRKVYHRLHGRSVSSQLDQDPPLPPPPQKTLILRASWKYRICSIDSIRQEAVKKLGSEAENYPIETQFVNDGKPARFIWGHQRDEEAKQVKINLPIRPRSNSKIGDGAPTRSTRRVYQIPSSRPLADSWKDFLLKEDTTVEQREVLQKQHAVPYASMTLEQKMQRANLILVYSMFKTFQAKNTCTAYSSSGSNSGENSSDTGQESRSSSRTSESRGKKRSRVDKRRERSNSSGKDDDAEESDDDAHRNKRANVLESIEKKVRIWGFACPYGKRHPDHFPKPICSIKGFDDINRLKQHLDRCHKLSPLRCEPCKVTFDNLEAMQNHALISPKCKKTDSQNPYAGFTEQQWVRIKCRKRPKAKHDEEREEAMWKHIYVILFPDQWSNIPSPYHPEQTSRRRHSTSSSPARREQDDFRKFLQEPPESSVLQELLIESRQFDPEMASNMEMHQMFQQALDAWAPLMNTVSETIQPIMNLASFLDSSFVESFLSEVPSLSEIFTEQDTSKASDQDTNLSYTDNLANGGSSSDHYILEHDTGTMKAEKDKGKGRAHSLPDEKSTRMTPAGSPAKDVKMVGKGGTVIGIRRESESPCITTPPVASS